MKVLLFLSVFVVSHYAISQTTDGYILYNIQITALDSSIENQQAAGLLQSSNMELFLAEKKSRLDFKMGDLYTTSMIIDHTSNLMLMLYDGMNGKTAALNAFDESQVSIPSVNANTKIVLIDESKEFLGYSCKKAITTLGSVETTYWYTDQIQVEAKGQDMVNAGLPGFPMFFSSEADGILMEYEVASIVLDTPQEDAVFSTEVPEGYVLQK